MDRFIATITGRRVTLTAGAPSLVDVAVSHVRTPMFAGHTILPYSVAHHCLAAAKIAEQDGATDRVILYCLLHELETSVYGDVPGPVKCPGQRAVEKALQSRAHEVYGTGPFGHHEWCLMETYDKLEQAASASWLGFPEPVHSTVWEGYSAAPRAKAVETTKNVYAAFPPKEQTAWDAPLAVGWFNEVQEFLVRTKIVQAREIWNQVATSVYLRAKEVGR